MSQTVLVVELDIHPSRFDEYLKIVRAHARNSEAEEPGCLRFDALVDREHPHKIFLIEVYADDGALDAHWGSDHMAAYRETVAEMVAHRVVHRCSL